MGTAGDSELRDSLLTNTYGITPFELVAVRDIPDLDGRIVMAANYLLTHAEQVAPLAPGTQITEMTLTAMVHRDWTEPVNLRKRVSESLVKKYKEKRDELETRFKVPYIHFLRNDVGAYSGNLLEAERVFLKFYASRFDFQQSVVIPLSLRPLDLKLLGIIWSMGHVSSLSTSSPYIDISGYKAVIGDNGSECFFDTIPQRIYRTFNIFPEVKHLVKKPSHVEIGDKEFETGECEYRRIKIGSSAITTWLTRDVGIFSGKGKPDLLIDEAGNCLSNIALFEGEDDIYSFLGGVVDGSGRSHMSDNGEGHKHSPFIYCHNRNPDVKNTILGLCKILGKTTNGSNNTAYIPTRITRELFRRGLIENPQHLEKLRTFY